jgi:hypothetical protein
MFRAMALKELRETVWIMLLVLAVCLLFFGGTIESIFRVFGANVEVQTSLTLYNAVNYVPFVTDCHVEHFYWICAAVAVALGLRQTLGESIGGTYPFLLHRPTYRYRLMGVKLLVGLAVYLACGSILILAYGLWAGVPGHHASPFEWSMTVTTWAALVEMALIYLAAFLSGLRPARWFGTRLLPLAAAVPLVFNLFPYPFRTGSVLHLCTVLVVGAWVTMVIVFVARTRDYS